eukprot:TRINITY_DN10726_c0_g1_i19.p1 TRINITY_DN10726_c0_g1~~TRINITY_DN10726_c0_g1_i19.p1  ORF type:complete len:287 (-),score=62.49 TRINITY_DN10726_c0_g1_i19:17-877(-)
MIVTIEKIPDKAKLSYVSLLRSFGLKSEFAVESENVRDLKWDVQVNSKVTCIKYYALKSAVAFGTEAGMLYVHPVLKSCELESSKDPTPAHTGAVRDICFEENEVYAISVGEDKRVMGTSLDGKVLYSSKVGEHGMTSVHFDAKVGLIVITNVNGELLVCDVKSLKPVLLRIVPLTKQTPILSSQMNWIYNVRWYEYGEEVEWKNLGSWRTEEKIICWTLYEKKHFLALANKKGNITFLNLATGTVRYNMQAHTDAIKAIAIDESSGMMVTSSKMSSVCIQPWPLS